MIGNWTRGLLRRRSARLTATAVGVAASVAALAGIGIFLAAAQSSMTDRAARSVVVDWQVQVEPTASPGGVLDLVRATDGVRTAVPVGFAHSSGFVSSAADTAATTGPGIVLGLPDGYSTNFPGALRTLTGTDSGVLLAQQTAANLHVTPGDTVEIGRAGLAPVPVMVDAVVELPQANSLFQTIGAPPAAQPVAPPDNVILIDQARWHTLFDPLAAARPDLVTTEIHAALDHSLPSDPASAYRVVTASAHNLEARSAGTALVGDNLGASLGAARSDAAYAQVLFLFLGLPAAVLAGLLTATVVATGQVRRRQEQSLLRARGACRSQLVRLAAVEAVVVGVGGSVVGLIVAGLAGWATFGSARFGATTAGAVGWAAAAAATGLAVAASAVLAPAWRDLRRMNVTAGRATVTAIGPPLWVRFKVDIALLVASGVLFWLTSRNGYELVLAPEGVPTISVSYWAFAAPALLWAGAALLIWRLSDLILGRGRRIIRTILRPYAGSLSQTVANSVSRQRRPLARGIVLLALALAFAFSTATFNATYRAQAEADAQLTNGADVTVTESPGNPVPPAAGTTLSAVPGVAAVEPIQHRFAYIGADLQDLYGVDPSSITSVTTVRDSYFRGGTATELMNQLRAQPDSILVSAETVKDFQLSPGDTVNLRLQDERTHQLATVPFHYVGVVAEFPTAPKDSFFVANAAYVAVQTGSDAVGAFLIDTGGTGTAAVAERIRAVIGTSATVTDITTTRGEVGSSLTSVNLAGLTRIELGYGFVLAAAAGALVLALGLAERRRGFAIASALGGSARQLRSFVVAEAGVLIVGGLLAGSLTGWVLSEMLVTVLTGVFDPPPTSLTVPWTYLAAVGSTLVVVVVVVAATTSHLARRAPLTALREL
ncbi:FtsX-like permease family protein [Rhodococcus qingshengii]|uniref:ABC transporter permease n=2 Tax=Rhodococcus TaxID=1827 RepID=A0AB38RD06_RHOSG|nr:ABC transporter permease [Rhodococcus qingshengii]ORC22387.1 ABC transporter permease [Rhodococcus qingshengii]UPU42949.1 ABC transporter permease [Rhodococcus qingshengii JCM 15477]